MDVTLETPMCSLETHFFSLETPIFSLVTPLFFWRPHIFMELILFSLETPRFPLGGLQRKNGISNSTPTMIIFSQTPYLITFFYCSLINSPFAFIKFHLLTEFIAQPTQPQDEENQLISGFSDIVTDYNRLNINYRFRSKSFNSLILNSVLCRYFKFIHRKIDKK